MTSHLASRRGWALALLVLGLIPLAAQAQQCKLEAKIQPENQIVDEGADVQINGEPSQPKSGTFVWTQISGPAITLDLSKNPSKPEFKAPQVIGNKQAVFQLTVFGCGSSQSVQTRIDIIDLNPPPANTAPTAMASASPELADEGVSVTLNSTGSTDNETPNQLAYQWTQVNNGAPTVILSGANTPTATFTAPHVTGPGVTLEFKLRVTDPGTLFNEDKAIVNVQFSNDSPFASLSCPMNADEGSTVTLDGSASSDYEDDALGKVLKYTWSQTLGPPYVNVADKTTESISFTAPPLSYGESGGIYFELTVTDSAGAYNKTTCGLIVDDATAPVIDGADDRIVEATSPAGASVDYGLSALDNVEGDVSGDIVCVPPSGETFAVDSDTTVKCHVTDISGNKAEVEFDVGVRDTTPPELDIPESDVALEADGPSGSFYSFEAKSNDLVDGERPADCVPPSDSEFPLGPTLVKCNAVDDHGNAAPEQTFTVRVVDTQPPVVTVPSAITMEATAPAGAAISFAVSALDTVSGSVTPVCIVGPDHEVHSGDFFAVGPHTVTCSATDGAGNKGTASFSVTVTDTTPPTVAVPANLILEATGPAGAAATFAATASDIVSGSISPTCRIVGPDLEVHSGDTFPLGTTTVACSATDGAGNTGSKSFTIKVQDTIAPEVTVPANTIEEATGPNGAAVAFSASALDIVSGPISPVCIIGPDQLVQSGDVFPLGKSTVTCTATDGAGNSAGKSFDIIVVDTTGPAIATHADLYATATGGSKAVVTFTNPTAHDLVDGNVAVDCQLPSGSEFLVGTTKINCSAQDGRTPPNKSTSTFNVIVNYVFDGFFSPVDKMPTVNLVQAGQGIPVKFSLGGNQGMNIFAAAYPRSTVMTCGASAQDAIEETSTAGSSTLQYDAGAGRYIYVWKTEKAWSGTCRQLQIVFADGSIQRANFQFKK